MTAPYKIALAAGATLLLVVIASLLLKTPPTATGLPDPIVGDAPRTPLPPPPSTDVATPPTVNLPFAPTPDPPAAGDPDASDDPDADPNRFKYAAGPAVDTLTIGRDPFAQGIRPPSIFEPVDPVAPDDPEPAPDPTAAPIALGPNDVPTGPAGPDQPAVPAAPPADAVRTYTIQSGDNLSSIALDLYGKSTLWVDIAQANPLIDPSRLKVGQVIKLPPQPGPPAATAAAPSPTQPTADLGRGTQYTVKENDTLSGIAKQFYSASSKWELIYQANRQAIGDDPGRVKPGTVLLIPPPDTGAR